MELTNKQEAGLKEAVSRHRNKEKYTVISGYAGTGKSTLVRFIIEAINVDEDEVAYCAYTGKAADVLRKKGNKNSMTLHRLLYDSIPRPGGGFFRIPKKHLDYKVIVVDEVSMVPKSMIDLLLSYRVYILFLGDPFQLPQIDKNEEHDLLVKPQVFLDEIMRQEAESEIIRLTMKIRAGEQIDYERGNEVCVIPKQELVTGHLLWADQILCATNNVRHNVNNQMRQLLGFNGVLQPGEKVIIKRNYWDICNDDGDVLVNGTIGTVDMPFESFVRLPNYIKNDRQDLPIIITNFTPDGESTFEGIDIDKDFLLTEQPCVDWRVAYKIGQLGNKIGDILPKQATYGYCLTAWNAQGSEWSKVTVLEEKFPYNKEEHARFLYTACTRAEDKLVLVRD